MTIKIFALVLLSLALAACESNAPENSNADRKAAAQTPSLPVESPKPEPSASPITTFKSGDPVMVRVNGSLVEATVVSIDDKTEKSVVRLKKEGKEQTVATVDLRKP